MDNQLIPIIDSEKSNQIKYLTIEEANEIFNFRFDIDKDISMNIKSVLNKPIIYYNKNKHFNYDQLLYLSFRDFQDKLGEYIPLNVIISINHKDKNNKFIMILSHKNLKDQFEVYSDFEKHYSRFNTLFNALDSNTELSIYYIDKGDITNLSVLFCEDYALYDLLINSLSKMVTELDNSEHKLFKYQEDEFSWTNLLSEYIFNIDLD